MLGPARPVRVSSEEGVSDSSPEQVAGMLRPSRLLLPLVVAPTLLLAARLAAESFVCAGYPAADSTAAPNGVAAKPAEVRDNPVSPHGRVHALVIFAQFKDEGPEDATAPAYAVDLFDPDLPGSFSHFYHTMSFGQLTVEGIVVPRRYTSDQPGAAYLSAEPEEPGQYGQFVLEILRQVDQDMDFSQFDNDGPDGIPNSGDDDGAVDYVFVCVRSTPYGFLFGGATGVGGLGSDAYYSEDASISGQAIRIRAEAEWGAIGREGTFAQTVGMMAHEFGHALGLPDLYDVDYDDPESDSAGIGRWGLMGWGAQGWNGDDGPNAFCAWSREQLGWLGADNERLVKVVADTAGLVLADLDAGGAIVKIPLPAGLIGGKRPGEGYLLLEQRTRSGTFYSRHLPAEGLLAWHIRPLTTATRTSRANNHERDKGVDLVCADGLYRDAGYPLGLNGDPIDGSDNLDFWAHDAAYREAHAGNMGDPTDPFDGVRYTRFGPGSNPSSAPRRPLSSALTDLALSVRRQGRPRCWMRCRRAGPG